MFPTGGQIPTTSIISMDKSISEQCVYVRRIEESLVSTYFIIVALSSTCCTCNHVLKERPKHVTPNTSDKLSMV